MKATERFFARVAAPLDGSLLSIVGGLILLGMLTLYSAASGNPARVSSQLFNLGIAFVLMCVAAQLPPQTLMRFAVPAYLVGLLLLLAVALFGDVRNGARRWLSVGAASVQPSEIMKIAMPLMLAWYFHKNEAALRLRDYIVAAVLLALPTLMIARQPDLGTAVLVASAGFYVIFLAGLSWKILVGVIAAGCAGMPFLWSLMHDYQRRRILTLLDPSEDPLGAGYHIIQSTIAVGSGGITGKGWLKGTQAHLEFIPERTTDFIFAVYSEEFGLLGNSLLLVLYLALIARGLMIASNAPTFFSRLLAGAVTLTFFTYAFVNMGMVSGIIPVVGVPLPLVSYGGTALVTLFLGIGILMSINKHRKLVQT
ncbi:MAG: rod shape-determining protein RodA [Betaproteobacteria bacterium RIFCSPLOWO2_12_FULL_63_13]|nr:MAG: rod shape-determining protein RodA [Betaproteobacteria bacterium RIFCSPLOWO2_02_FULL_63_19]OGA42963.1 MAG: rod shape-determining protein RodA [Betaproteobacteria bacterium RIFCSPLOWO2_12_FULL_63_13]